MENTIAHDAAPLVIEGRNGGRLTPFNSETARAAVRAREEKRMRLYNEGARRAVQDVTLIREYGEDAHLVERAMTLQAIASTPDAGKAAVMADAALQRAQGYETPRGTQDDQAAQVITAVANAYTAETMAQLWRDVQAQARGEVIEAE
jgi:hypothetical protein